MALGKEQKRVNMNTRQQQVKQINEFIYLHVGSFVNEYGTRKVDTQQRIGKATTGRSMGWVRLGAHI